MDLTRPFGPLIFLVMSKTPASFDIPKKPTERRAWIRFQLDLKGTNFRAIANEQGCSRQAVSYAAAGYPSEELEAVLAEILGVPHQALFPEHFGEGGERIPLARTRQRKSTPLIPQRNVYSREAS